jgi:hypothetical protein
MNVTVSDLIVTPCRVLYSTVGLTLPADTVAYGGAWPAGWTELGATKTPLTIELTRETALADIQETLTEITRAIKKEALTAETTMAELDPDNIALSWGGTVSVTPAGASQPGKDELLGGDTTAIAERQWGFEGSYVSAAGNTHPIRFYIWKGVSAFGAKLEFGKADPTGTTLRIVANPDLSKAAGQRLYKWVKITAPASS